MSNPNGHPANLKKFKTGDQRINRRGRPKTFDSLRRLAQSIAHGELPDAGGMTVTEAILRRWASSKDARLQIQFMEVAFGKVPQVTELEHRGKITTESTVRHAIDADTAESIFDILAAAGALPNLAGDAEADEIYPGDDNR